MALSDNPFTGIDGATLAALKSQYTQALKDVVAAGQSYSFPGRTFTRADISELRDTLYQINIATRILTGKGGYAVAHGVFRTSEPGQVGSASGAVVPSGCFCNVVVHQPILEAPQVDGAVVFASWKDCEPTQGVQNYTSGSGVGNVNVPIDTQMSSVATVNAVRAGAGLHPLALRLDLGIGATFDAAGGHKPGWLQTLIQNSTDPRDRFFQYNPGAVKVIVPWSPIFLSLAANFAKNIYNHLGNNVVFTCNSPWLALGPTNDWNLGAFNNVVDDAGGTLDLYPGGPGGNPATTPQGRWLNTLVGTGYATWADGAIAAGNYLVDAIMKACPGWIVQTHVNRALSAVLNPYDTTFGKNVAQTVARNMYALYPNRFGITKWNVNGGPTGMGFAPQSPSSQWHDYWELQGFKFGQSTWTAFGDTNCSSFFTDRMNAGAGSGCLGSTRMLAAAIQHAYSFGLQFYEIYQADLENGGPTNADPDPGPIVNCLQFAHDTLFQRAWTGPPWF